MSKQGQDGQIQSQFALQLVSDIWERVLFTLEVLEFSYKEISQYPNYDMDKIFAGIPAHSKQRIEAEHRLQSGDVLEADQLVQLQVRAFKRGIANKDFNLTNDMLWVGKDFLSWLGGRKNIEWSRVDEYSLAILTSLENISYEEMLRYVPEPLEEYELPLSQNDLIKVVENFAIGGEAINAQKEKFMQQEPPLPESLKNMRGNLVNQHQRGDMQDGIDRILANWKNAQKIRWFKNEFLPKIERETIV